MATADERPLRDWTYEETISPEKTYVQQYVEDATGDSGFGVVTFASKSSSTTTFRDVQYYNEDGILQTESVAVRRESKTTTAVGPANPTRWKSKLEAGSPARAADPLEARSETIYENVGTPTGVRVKKETTIEYEPRIAFAGGLGIQNWKGIDLGLSSTPVSRTETIYEWDDAADLTKTTVNRWLSWGKTQEGANGAAAVAKALETLDDAERIARINELVVFCEEFVFDGTEVRISRGRGSSMAQTQGTKQDQVRNVLKRDPARRRGGWVMNGDDDSGPFNDGLDGRRNTAYSGERSDSSSPYTTTDSVVLDFTPLRSTSSFGPIDGVDGGVGGGPGDGGDDGDGGPDAPPGPTLDDVTIDFSDSTVVLDPLASNIATYRLPLPSDDVIIGVMVDDSTMQPMVVSGNVEEQARTFAQMQNYLATGHTSGQAITTEVRNIPTDPLGAMFLEVAGVSGVFRANGTSWAWGPEGMIVATDAMLHGAAGTYGTSEFAESWVPIPTAVANLPALGAATVNANPKPANTITTPGGFDPAAPGTIWASLPTDGIDVPKASRSVTAALKPRNERVRMLGRIRTKVLIREYDYPLALGTTTLRLVSRTRLQMPAIVALPLTTITVTALAPIVESPAEVNLPLTTITVTAPAPTVEQAGVSIVLPTTTIDVTALAPAVGTPDPNFSNVALLLPFDGPDNSTTITDFSPSPKTITVFGTAKISTAQSQWGGAALFSAGSGDALQATSSDFAFGTGVGTVEFWLRPLLSNATSFGRIIQVGDFPLNGAWQLVRNSTTNPLQLWLDLTDSGTSALRLQPTTPTLSSTAFTHVAITFNRPTVTIYVAGSSIASGSYNYNLTRTDLTIFNNTGRSNGLDGRMDDLRITKGILRYTSNFTPPTAPFPTL